MMISLRCWSSLAIILAICLQLASFSQGSANTLPLQQPQDQIIYVPFISQPQSEYTRPVLTGPANGDQLTTLIPTLMWSHGPQPREAVGCLAIDTAPHPTDCDRIFGTSYVFTGFWVVDHNLEPGTTYYWRVGIKPTAASPVSIWSEERSFITGAAGGTYPAAPGLVSPLNNSTVSPNEITFSWNSVSGATAYLVKLHNKTTNDFCQYTRTDVQLTLTSDDACFNYFGTSYEWSVTARNAYAWGPPSETWTFSTSTN